MKLLIITQKMDRDDPVLGFFHGWVAEFAKHFESIILICLEKGKYDLPANVRVLSLGKEEKHSRMRYISRFYRYAWRERKDYDAVFVHMNQVYVIMGWIIWRLLGKKITLWYTHKSVTVSLKVTEKLADKIFTASKESFRLMSRKLFVTGHGIDTDYFAPRRGGSHDDPLKIVTIGRISPAKRSETVIEALSLLQTGGKIDRINLDIVGGPILPTDREYEKKLRDFVRQKHLELAVRFVGPVKPKEVVDYLHRSDLFVHESMTGSLDKAPLEAMSSGIVVVSSNDAMWPILEPFRLAFEKDNAFDLSRMIQKVNRMTKDERTSIGGRLREVVVRDHSLRSLACLIAKKINE